MHDTAVRYLSRFHTSLFRVTRGRVGSRLVDNDMLLLTTTGRTSGRTHTVPLLYLLDGDDLVVIASYGGRPDHPDWYLNLLGDPESTAHVGAEAFAVTAETMSNDERQAWWPVVVEAYSDYAVYQSRTARPIPVVRLRRDVRQQG